MSCPTAHGAASWLPLRLPIPRIANFVYPDQGDGASVGSVILRPFLVDETSCASYLFGCLTERRLAHHAYLVSDLRRGTDEPWLVVTGDSLLVGDVGRPDLHAGGDHVLVFPSHYAGSVCGRTLSGNPISTIGFERRHNCALADDAETFVQQLLVDLPPPPIDQAAIVAANRRGVAPAPR